MSDHWSYSQFQVFSTCAAQYRRHYIQGEAEVVEPPYEVGSLFHQAAEQYGRHCLAIGHGTDLDYARHLAAGYRQTAADASRMREVGETVADLVENWAEWWVFDLALVAAEGDSIERWLERDLDGERIVGRVDLVQYDRGTQQLWLTDFKTSWQPYQGEAAPWQLMLYAWLLLGQETYQHVDEVMAMYCYVPRRLVREWVLSRDYLEREVPARLRGMIAEVRREQKWEPRPGPYCAWCGYAPVCEAGRWWSEVEPTTPEAAARLAAGIELERVRLKAREQALRDACERFGPITTCSGTRWQQWAPAYALEDGTAYTASVEDLLALYAGDVDRLPLDLLKVKDKLGPDGRAKREVRQERLGVLIRALARVGASLSDFVEVDAEALTRYVSALQAQAEAQVELQDAEANPFADLDGTEEELQAAREAARARLAELEPYLGRVPVATRFMGRQPKGTE